MDTITWILKGLLAALFFSTGIFKLLFPKAALLEKGMKGLVDLGDREIKMVGLLELLGAAGLILPGLLGIYPVLSGIAALGLGVTMIVAAIKHRQHKLPVLPNLVILAICLVVAYRVFFS
jgi:uncharacterized membrane protein